MFSFFDGITISVYPLGIGVFYLKSESAGFEEKLLKFGSTVLRSLPVTPMIKKMVALMRSISAVYVVFVELSVRHVLMFETALTITLFLD